jgi:hypothetical protein
MRASRRKCLLVCQLATDRDHQDRWPAWIVPVEGFLVGSAAFVVACPMWRSSVVTPSHDAAYGRGMMPTHTAP